MTKLRCWPGALCVIVGSEYPENLGKFAISVRVEGKWNGRTEWLCTAQSSLVGDREGQIVAVSPGETFYIWDHDLRPITPPDNSVDTSEVEDLYLPGPSVREEEPSIHLI